MLDCEGHIKLADFGLARLAVKSNQILKTFCVEYITRAIGPVPRFDMDTVFSTKRRKRKDLSKFQISINNDDLNIN